MCGGDLQLIPSGQDVSDLYLSYNLLGSVTGLPMLSSDFGVTLGTINTSYISAITIEDLVFETTGSPVTGYAYSGIPRIGKITIKALLNSQTARDFNSWLDAAMAGNANVMDMNIIPDPINNNVTAYQFFNCMPTGRSIFPQGSGTGPIFHEQLMTITCGQLNIGYRGLQTPVTNSVMTQYTNGSTNIMSDVFIQYQDRNGVPVLIRDYKNIFPVRYIFPVFNGASRDLLNFGIVLKPRSVN